MYFCIMKLRLKPTLQIAFFVLISSVTFSQDSIYRVTFRSQIPNLLISSSLYTGFTYTQSQNFFTAYPKSDFHLKQDWKTWRGMDKFFHAYGSYQLTSVFYELNKLSKLPPTKALNIALIESFIFSTTKEWCDGHIDVGGWSWYDIGMNISGNALFYFQEKYWKEQKIKYKYNYFNSGLQHYQPNVLGTNYAKYLLHDYNGQNNWLCTSLGSLGLTENKWLKPLGLAIGYGAQNVILEFKNPVYAPLTRYSQAFFAIDIDCSQIQTNNKVLKSLFYLVNRIKIPLPNIEYNSLGKFQFNIFKS
jgi:uncharacterized protein YfiM (DUF2279 family)